jgi:hypothetical protein
MPSAHNNKDGNACCMFEVAVERNRAFIVRRADLRVVAKLDRLEAFILKVRAEHSPDETRSIVAIAAGASATGSFRAACGGRGPDLAHSA